ncbi:MAG: hypothetical protein HY553_07095 [Elusimicrobia bacterium]|nr:hypothetical protein [Elusimicrobiota bacterium]
MPLLCRAAAGLWLPLAALAAPTVEVPIPAIVFLQGVSGVAAAPALGTVFDGSSRLLPALSPVLVPSRLAAAPAAEPLERAHPEPKAPESPFGRPLDRTAPDSGGVAETIPGSIFEWKPPTDSPGHGFPPVDVLARRLASMEDRRWADGFAFGSAPRDEARVFLYGETHGDEGLIRENMRLLAEDLKRGRGGLILDEGYMGPTLHGTDALRYLEAKGLEAAWLGPAQAKWPDLEVRGWDAQGPYDLSRTATLRYTMAQYELNRLMHSDRRGPGYYGDLFRKALETIRAWREARSVAIDGRNPSLDQSVARAVRVAREGDRTLHVIAGAEHLVASPLLNGLPLVGRARPRAELAAAIGDAPYAASMPAAARTPPRTPELAFAAGAAAELARLADELGAATGQKASAMSGRDFVALIETARSRFAADGGATAPSPAAFQAALVVHESIARVAVALLDPAQPVRPQLPRLLSVWQVFSQELEAASTEGTLEAIEAEAKLFASQVEDSV